MANPLHFDLQSLRVFIAVAEWGSLTRAAEHCQLTLSAVSKRIAELETVADCALLARHARGVELTTAGRGLLAHATMLLDQVNRMASEMSDYAVGVRGHVRIWANTSAIVQFLPADLKAFLAINPSVRISLEERLSNEIVEAVGNGKADLGVFADNVPAPLLERQRYRDDQLVLLVPASHRFARRKTIGFEEALDEEFVGLNEGSSLLSRMREAALAVNRAIRIRIQVTSFDGICRMIEAGLGIGVLPQGAVRAELLAAGLSTVPLRDPWARRTLWVGAPGDQTLTPEAKRLFEFLSAPKKGRTSRSG
jgi:DNA-binding transcriptional LysR family regulator